MATGTHLLSVTKPVTRHPFHSFPRPSSPTAAIVAGALGIVRDTLNEFPSMSVEGKERLIQNLMVTLTSHQSPTAVIPLAQ